MTGRLALRNAIGLGLVALLIATGRVYYSCFALLLCVVALVWRFAQGARWRALLVGVASVATRAYGH